MKDKPANRFTVPNPLRFPSGIDDALAHLIEDAKREGVESFAFFAVRPDGSGYANSYIPNDAHVFSLMGGTFALAHRIGSNLLHFDPRWEEITAEEPK